MIIYQLGMCEIYCKKYYVSSIIDNHLALEFRNNMM